MPIVYRFKLSKNSIFRNYWIISSSDLTINMFKQNNYSKHSFRDNLKQIILQSTLLSGWNFSVWKWFCSTDIKRWVCPWKGWEWRFSGKSTRGSLIRACVPGEKSSPELYCYQRHSRRNDTRSQNCILVYVAKEITRNSYFSAFRRVICATQNMKSCWN